jgi:hypothetical protein
LFRKTEHRYAEFDTKNVPVVVAATRLSNGFLEHTSFTEQTIRSTLTYRFNWSGVPVAAKY